MSAVALLSGLGIAVLGSISFLIAYTVLNHLSWRWALRHIPGPPASLVLGNLGDIMKGPPLHVLMTTWSKQYGPVFKMFLGSEPLIVVTDKVLTHTAVVKRFAVFHDRSPFRVSALSPKNAKCAMEELFFARGSFWGTARAALQPMFHTASLTSFSSVINEDAEILRERLAQPAADGRSVDILRYMGYLTIDVIGKAAFGIEVGSQKAASRGDEDRLMFVQAVKTCFERFSITSGGVLGGLARIVPPTLTPFFMWLYTVVMPDEDVHLQDWARAVTFSTASHLLQNTKKSQGLANGAPDMSWTWWDENKLDTPYKDEVPADNSIIHHMLKAKTKDGRQGMTDVQIVAQCHDLLAGGYETTSATLSVTLWCVAKYKDAAEKVYKEIDAWGRNRPVMLEDFAAFPQTEAFLKEAMRLFPVASYFGRQTNADIQLGGYKLPAGIAVLMNSYGVLMDPAVFTDPTKFDPQRYIREDEGVADSWMLFGVGPRMCVGYKLAMMEMKIVLIRLMQKYTFEIDSTAHRGDELAMKLRLTWAPANGVHLIPKLRS